MPKVVIVVQARRNGIERSLTNVQMVSALMQAIASATHSYEVQVVQTGIDLEFNNTWMVSWGKDVIICPLTLNLPPNLTFEAQRVYQDCRDISSLRQRVEQQLECCVGKGCFWLPVVLTAKVPLYGEVIALAGVRSPEQLPEDLFGSDLSYYQPFHLSDLQRQQLYQLGKNLLQLLAAPPATYLLQFGLEGSKICFDRLYPFPATPAIASLGVQQPDLFACHWLCLISQPVFDLTISPPIN